MFAIKMTRGVHRAAEREGHLHCFHDRFSIGHGECAGVTHADGAHGRVWRFAERVIVAITEHFRLRVHLGMHFKTDDSFQLRHFDYSTRADGFFSA